MTPNSLSVTIYLQIMLVVPLFLQFIYVSLPLVTSLIFDATFTFFISYLRCYNAIVKNIKIQKTLNLLS